MFIMTSGYRTNRLSLKSVIKNLGLSGLHVFAVYELHGFHILPHALSHLIQIPIQAVQNYEKIYQVPYDGTT